MAAWDRYAAGERECAREVVGLTLFPRRDLGRDGDMRMVALRRSVHRGEW